MNKTSNIAVSGWSDGQCTMFAKRFARSAEGLAWWAFVEDIRKALIDAFVLDLIFCQNGEVRVEDIRSLRKRLMDELSTKHSLKVSNQNGPDDCQDTGPEW